MTLSEGVGGTSRSEVSLRLALPPTPLWRVVCSQRPPPPLAPGLPLPRLLELITRNLAAFRSAVCAPAAWAMTFSEPPGSDLHCEGRALYLAWEVPPMAVLQQQQQQRQGISL